MHKLSLIDDTFLRFESRRLPLHIGMLMLFEPAQDAPPDFVMKLAERLRQSVRPASPFNRRLVRKRGINYWVETDDFDIDHHLVHVALPKPGRIRELLAMVSRVHGGHLDRAYPLWRLYLIEGIEDGRFALYMKAHHSMVDGIAGMRMLLESMSTTVEGSLRLPPVWEIPVKKATSQPVPDPATGGLSAVRPLTRTGLKSFSPVWQELRSNLEDYRSGNPNFVAAGQAPRCIFNQSVSATRRFAAQSYSTQRIRTVASAFGATINDVVLAMCGGALRRYLIERDELPDRPLVAGVPVSLRRNKAKKLGNEVAFTFTHLGTNLADPVARMRAIKGCMDYNKEHLKNLTPDQSMVCAAAKLLPSALNAVMGNPRDSTMGNVVISYVPGPRRTMYWQGAKLLGLYPASLLIDGSALNITLVSRRDYVDFGLIACRKAVPQMQRLLDYLEDSLVELEEAVDRL